MLAFEGLSSIVFNDQVHLKKYIEIKTTFLNNCKCRKTSSQSNKTLRFVHKYPGCFGLQKQNKSNILCT